MKHKKKAQQRSKHHFDNGNYQLDYSFASTTKLTQRIGRRGASPNAYYSFIVSIGIKKCKRMKKEYFGW